MTDPKEIVQLVQKTVAEVFASHVDELRLEITSRVSESLELALAELVAAAQAQSPSASVHPPGGSPTDLLSASVNSIFDSPGQADILRSLLDGVAQFSARAVLFVVKGGNISAWQSRGFDNDVKGLTLSGSTGLIGRAMQDKEPVSAAAGEFDAGFVATHGNPFDGNATVHPLIVREKVAAMIYTDGGTEMDGHSDQSAVRILVRAASSWLEIMALRKAAGSGGVEAPAEAMPPPPPAPEPQAKAAPATPTPAAAAASLDGLSSEEQEVHKKAKRFAKLLVDEIKLYNQAKVAEGRQNRDLYSRLKEDIDKSRNTYDKRYGSTAAASAGYFSSEVIRILADNDPAMLGDGFA